MVAFPPGQMTVGRAAIRALYEQMLAAKPHFELEKPLPTLHCGDLALTSTPALDEAGARAFAKVVWERINLPNLRDHIVAARDLADIVINKSSGHAIEAIGGKWVPRSVR